jgi:hypothetical protein
MDTFQGDKAAQVKMAVEGETGLVRNLSPGNAPSVQTSIFVNAGGKDDYTDKKGNIWVPDSSFVSSGRTYQKSSQPIANTDKQPIYQSERYAPELKYEIPVANGKFDVYLHWAGKLINRAVTQLTMLHVLTHFFYAFVSFKKSIMEPSRRELVN